MNYEICARCKFWGPDPDVPDGTLKPCNVRLPPWVEDAIEFERYTNADEGCDLWKPRVVQWEPAIGT
jgi:hypothetical protein